MACDRLVIFITPSRRQHPSIVDHHADGPRIITRCAAGLNLEILQSRFFLDFQHLFGLCEYSPIPKQSAL